MAHPLAHDLDHILAHTAGVWNELRHARIFITGGTGFFGTWLLESFAWANDHLSLDARAVVLSRNPAAFAKKAPHLASRRDISWLRGDVIDFSFPAEPLTHIIHAATETLGSLAKEDPAGLIRSIVDGTSRMLSLARASRAKRFLLTSSGAIYGLQPPDVSHISEQFAGGPDLTQTTSAYGEAKRLAELLCVIAAQEGYVETSIARCFAFIGPHLALDAHFAAGNFIRDRLSNSPIRIVGDGTPMRSYLYAADLAIWLWTLLVKGPSGRAYNVGSSKAVSIAELAEVVATIEEPHVKIELARSPQRGVVPQRYVPNCDRALAELGLQPRIDLPEAARRTIAWHRSSHIV